MPTFNYPYIRDTLLINQNVQDFYNGFVGPGPVFLIGREVRHDSGFQLRVRALPIVIVADVYDGAGGVIDARGNDSGGVGVRGVDGKFPNPAFRTDSSGIDIPIAPGGSGTGGGTGSAGEAGATVTVYCRRSINASITVVGGRGAPGGAGGNGSAGVHGQFIAAHTEQVDLTPGDPFDFEFSEVQVPEQTIAGTPGGDGGGGGSGGSGGNGGTITFTSIVDDVPPTFVVHGGEGGPGGPGGLAGVSGNFSETDATAGPDGLVGDAGPDGQVTQSNISEADYVAGLRSVLNAAGAPYANFWAPFRIVVGEYFYHRYNSSVPDRVRFLELAAIEFARALELQPDNTDALRLQAQLGGSPQVVEATGEVVWVGGGNNALGLPRDFDVLPNFDAYIRPFTEFGDQALEFLTQAAQALATTTTLAALQSIVDLQKADAVAARKNINDDLAIATEEKRQASDDSDYIQRQLEQTTSEIRAALAEMRGSPFTIGGFLGTVAEVGVAIVSVVAAIPTAGASLVGLVPAMVALANTAFDQAEPIANAVLAGSDPDTTAVEDAYAKVDKRATAIVTGGKRIVNFISVVQRLNASTTPDNAKHLALVKRGAELAHQALIALNRVNLADQRLNATRAKLSRADGVVAQADGVLTQLQRDAASVRRAGVLAIGVAQSRADALLGMAFRAQRSVEIYTLRNQEQNVLLDAGLLHPDIWRQYYEEEIDGPELHAELITSWGQLLAPISMQTDYFSYFDQAHDQDRLRLSFAASDPELAAFRSSGRLNFRVEASDIPTGRADAKVRSVRLALVGASHPNGEVSCEVRHGGKYEQRRVDETVTVQLLKPLVSTRPAKLERLAADEGLGSDPPLTAPQSLAFWGRGIGGEWEVSILGSRINSGLDLTGLTEIQVWIGYQFLR
jgi:hypothetical protein